MTAPANKAQAQARAPKRSRFVRWQGLLIFFVLCALAAGFWLLFVNRFAERTIEKTGTAVMGAKVELDKADVSLSPLGLTLLGLKVTDPDAPMTNAFEVGRIAFQMDGPNALRRKIIIEEMSVEDVRLNTPRKTSGAVAGTAGKTPLQQLTELPSFVIPNVKEVFEKEKDDLRSLKLLTGAAADGEAMRTRWDGKLQELKAAADVDKYQKRFDELKAKTGKASIGNLLGGAKDVAALQKQVRDDIRTVTDAKKAFTADLSTLKKVAADTPAAVRDDARRLIDKYSLTPSGLTNISRMLVGGRIAAGVQSALQWNERLSPFIERVKEKVKGKEVVKSLRAKGRDVRFREDQPLPDFLARLTKVSVSLPQGIFAGKIENLTSDQDILGRPLKFSFSAENLKGLRSAALEGMFDRVDPAARKDVLNLKLRGYEAHDVKLVESAPLPVSLREGLADLDISATLEKGGLTARITAGVRSARLAFEEREERPGLAGRVDEAIRKALTSVTSLSLTAEISGTPESFDLKIRSDIDEVLRSAVGALVRDQMAGFEKGLQEAIGGEAAGPLEKLNLGLKGLDAIGIEFDSLNKRLGDLLKKWK
jgi:uncharacterized protein (TIGR03545 family)